MIGTIIGAIVVGLVVGGLARLIMPGKQNIGVVMTVILG
ncbi:MAG: GlsB/YeaQ/YmgE family stress response membrane protein, partial [Mycobacterium sp.]